MTKNEYYIGIKVTGIKHWLWFKQGEVKRKEGTFYGSDGWGEGGCHLKTFSVAEKCIEGEVESQSLMYTR